MTSRGLLMVKLSTSNNIKENGSSKGQDVAVKKLLSENRECNDNNAERIACETESVEKCLEQPQQEKCLERPLEEKCLEQPQEDKCLENPLEEKCLEKPLEEKCLELPPRNKSLNPDETFCNSFLDTSAGGINLSDIDNLQPISAEIETFQVEDSFDYAAESTSKIDFEGASPRIVPGNPNLNSGGMTDSLNNTEESSICNIDCLQSFSAGDVTLTLPLLTSKTTESYYNELNFDNGPVELYLEQITTTSDDSINDPDYYPSDQSDTTPSNHEEQDPALESDAIENQNNEHTVAVGRPKRGRKRKYGNLTRSERTEKKYRYEEHINFAKKHVQVKSFLDFDCKCKNGCKDKVPVDVRRREFEKFKELGNYNGQNMYINANVKEFPKKRSYVMKKGVKSKPKSFYRIYCLSKVVVCREMFVKTLNISSKRVNTALSKMKSESLVDQRGKQGGWNAIPENKMKEVKECIESIPKYISHYRRRETNTLFLPPDMTISKMYDLYVNGRLKNEVVSLASFKKIFYNNYNLKFKALKKDTCNKCDMFAVKLSSTDNEEEKTAIKGEHDQHLVMAESAQTRLKNDMIAAASNDKLECLTFDLQKTLPLPRVPTNIVYYKRQLWIYNCGIHSGSTDKGYCNTWVEGQAGRGSQEIGSCLLRYIQKEVPVGTENLLLWSDSCGGQNRNIKIVLMLKTALQEHPTLQSITQRFPIPGHSFLPNDDDFGKIENALKKQQYLYCPEDYFSIMESCKKKNPLSVIRMNETDFFSCSGLENLITNRKKDLSKQDINWLKTREIVLKKDKPMSIFLSDKFDGPHQEVDIKKRRPGRHSTVLDSSQLVQLWPNGKPVAEPKVKDLKSLFHLIPKNHHEFYKKLISDPNIEDDIDGFGGEPDFEITEDE